MRRLHCCRLLSVSHKRVDIAETLHLQTYECLLKVSNDPNGVFDFAFVETDDARVTERIHDE